MKIQEFAKYKKLSESMDSESLNENEEALRVYNWMEESGRLDEGVLSGIWNWLKKNFSLKARKLHALASEYENELREELKAEWKKSKDPQDLAAKFRAGTYNRLSRDIEEKMRIVAEDDEVYKELVSALINEKDLKVKKELLHELTGQMDPDDSGTRYLRNLSNESRKKYKEAQEEVDKLDRDLVINSKDKIIKIIAFMKKRLSTERTRFRILNLRYEEEQTDFIKLMYIYTSALSEKDKSVEFTPKGVYEISKQYLEAVKKIVSSLERDGMETDDAVETVKDEFEKHMKDLKNIKRIDAIARIVSKDLESSTGLEDEVEDEVTTKYTSVFLSDDELEKAIDTAIEDTDEENPTVQDVVDEIREEVEKLFQKDNLSTYADNINRKIEDFNDDTREDRKDEADKYDYVVTSDYKLAPCDVDDVKDMIPAFIDVVGGIVPYYSADDKKTLVTIVKRFMFEIYAMKKDHTKKLSDQQKEQLISNIRAKYK